MEMRLYPPGPYSSGVSSLSRFTAVGRTIWGREEEDAMDEVRGVGRAVDLNLELMMGRGSAPVMVDMMELVDD